MGRKHKKKNVKKHHTIILGSEYYDDFDEYYDEFYNSPYYDSTIYSLPKTKIETKAYKEKSKKVIPNFKVCPTHELI